MGDVMTKEERAFAEKLRSHVSITGRVHGNSATALATIDRLVAEVERLRTLLRRALHPNDGMSKEWYEDAISALNAGSGGGT